MPTSRVRIPRSVRPPFEVFLNGVPQQEGRDFRVEDGALVFDRPLEREGRLSAWRWFLGMWGIGTYNRDDVVDVRYEVAGVPRVAHALPLEPLERGRKGHAGAEDLPDRPADR